MTAARTVVSTAKLEKKGSEKTWIHLQKKKKTISNIQHHFLMQHPTHNPSLNHISSYCKLGSIICLWPSFLCVWGKPWRNSDSPAVRHHITLRTRHVNAIWNYKDILGVSGLNSQKPKVCHVTRSALFIPALCTRGRIYLIGSKMGTPSRELT